MGAAKKSAKEPKSPKRLDRIDAKRIDALQEEVRQQRADLARNGQLLAAMLESSEVMRAQLDSVSAGQRRTNELLELSLGAALDIELETPDPRT